MQKLLLVLAAVAVVVVAKKWNEIDIVARTAWGEARGEGSDGMQAVINVIYNRASSPVVWWGRSPVEVALHDYQFSVWNEDDPNRAIMLAVTEDNPAFKQAKQLARKAAFGQLDDLTGGATHYFNPDVAMPHWAADLDPLGTIGAHRFYREA